jgi:pimeloyl-ACP methyl ester carboxylesterase
MTLHHELTGSGAPVVLLHEGITDSRMWDPQWSTFARRYRLLRCDLAGFGSTPLPASSLGHARSVAELLDEVGITRAAVVGCSLGGRVALELAVARPDLVGALVLVGAGLPEHDWSQKVRDYAAAEDEAVARGDLDAATELNLRMWVDGPRRAPSDVDPAVRARVGEMQRRALELQVPRWESLEEELLVPDIADRLAEVRVPTLVMVGDEDVDDMHRIAERLTSTISGARHVTIPGAAHVPSLEQPAAFDALVLAFLGEALT